MGLLGRIANIKDTALDAKGSSSIFNRNKNTSIVVDSAIKAEMIKELETYSKPATIHSMKTGEAQSIKVMAMGVPCVYDTVIAKKERPVEFVKLLTIGNQSIDVIENGQKYSINGYIVGYIMRNVGTEKLVFKQIIVDQDGRNAYDRQVVNPGEDFIINITAIGYLMALRVSGTNFNFASDNGKLNFTKNGLNIGEVSKSAIRVEEINDNGLIGAISKKFKRYILIDNNVKKIIGNYNWVARRPLQIQKVLIYGTAPKEQTNQKVVEIQGKTVGYLITNVSERVVKFSQRAGNGNKVPVNLKPGASHIIHREVLRELKALNIEFTNAIIVNDDTLPYIRLSIKGKDVSVKDSRVARPICAVANGKTIIDPKVLPYIPRDLLA